MWCRAILTITLLACTFRRTNGESHDKKDLLCVLILSGLQKEDLDVALLRKLQRHNVNVDDLDNADIRYECKNENGSNSDNETKNDVPKSMRKQFHTNQTTIPSSDKIENQTIEVNTTAAEENITKLIKLFSSITPEVNIQTIKEDTTTTKFVTTEKPRAMSEQNSITYMNKVLKQFLAQVTATPTTTTQATTVNDLKSILYEIKDMLTNKTVTGRKASTENKNSRQEEHFDDDSLKIKVYTKAIHDRIANKMKWLRRQKQNDELVHESQEFSDDRPIKDKKPSSLSQHVPIKQTTRTESIQNDGKVIPENVIKDIAESVKALVLQDLKKEMSTTTSTSTASTTEIETTSVATTNQENDFAKFMQLFQQFKNNIPVVDNNLTGQTKQEITRKITIAPTLAKTPYNPYDNPVINHVIHNMQIPNLNRELQSLSLYKPPAINRIDQVNIFNPKHETLPITIQSNVGQIPPLKIPMMAPPIKMVYQNIVVTTENTFEYFKSLHKQKYPPNINAQYPYNTDHRKSSTKPQYPTMVESPNYNYLKPFDHTRYQSDVERMRTPYYFGHNYYPKNEHAIRSRNRNFERFHEKLERADRNEWPQYYNDNEHQQAHIHVEKMRVAPRQQQPLNDKKLKFDDTHFKNFLKTQQKVNNMLERILATKTIEGPKNV